MGYRSGQHGRMLIKNTDIGTIGGEEFVYRIRNWSINYQQSVLDTTCLGDYDRTLLDGVRSASGSGTLLYYSEDGNNERTNFSQLRRNFIKRPGQNDATKYNPYDRDYGQIAAHPDNGRSELVRLHLKLDDELDPNSDNTDEDIVFYAYITSLGVSASVGEVVTCDFSFEVHGAPVLINL